MKKTARSVRFNSSLVALGLAFLALSSGPLLAQGLTIEPITWNVIGLDSNNVDVGPNRFPVGARVCNTTSLSKSVSSALVWDSSTATYIYTRPGTSETLGPVTIAGNSCYDFYYEVEVLRDSTSYNKTRRYHITATEGSTTVSTPTPRELFVEHLISQSRNAVTDVGLSTDGSSFTSVAPGGTLSLMVGQTYWIKLTGKTATNGYEQIESFINLPNTIFRVQSVATTYTADTTDRYPPADTLYTDGCLWVNDPLNPNYRSCVETGKAGGDITVTYKVLVISMPADPLSNPEALSTLVYDFSGSSYHYNSDFGGSTRYVKIVNASIEKSFAPKALNPNTIPAETSTLTFTITNPGPDAISSVNFVDNLPTNGGAGQMSIAATGVTYTTCGLSPSPASGSLTVGQTSLSFTNLTVAGLGTCTIAVTVTVNATGTYNNDSQNLFINSTIDTGDDAKDTLVATDKPPGPSTCTPSSTLATWTMPTAGQGSGGPPPPYTFKATDVATATASSSGGTTVRISTVEGSPTVNSWEILGGWESIGTLPNANGVPYFQFQVDTSNYGGAAISFDVKIDPPGAWQSAGANNVIYVYSSVDGSTWSNVGNFFGDKGKWVSSGIQAATSTGVSLTTFRINAAGAATTSSTVFVDNVTITGCPRPLRPTLAKAFSPASICLDGGYSALTFTFTNPNASALTGVGFTDTLPAGLLINTPNGLTTVTCTPANSISGQTITATAGGTTVSMSGATLAANSSCSFSVDVQGTVAGSYRNVSGNITSTQTGVNTTSSGYGSANLDVVAPPVIGKAFGTTTLITNETTSLTFNITNPNTSSSLTGVAFTDSLPSGLVVATPNGLSGSCGGGTINASAGTISLTNATLTAGSSCTFSVNVTGTTAGEKTNTVQVTSTNGCAGNTATAILEVRDLAPALALMKQVSTSAGGPWYESVIVPVGQTVYYRFMVENTGPVPLTGLTITDSIIPSVTCSWSPVLPLPVAAPPNIDPNDDDDHITACVASTTSVAGSWTNTAYATATSGAGPATSNEDTANYMNGNFGHLPSAYLDMNLYNDGGAFALNCASTARFGNAVTTTDSDGINTVDYTLKATDDGVTWTPGVEWTGGTLPSTPGSGSMNVTVYCPGTCYVNGWIDWSRDNTFDDTGEHLFTNVTVTGSQTYTWPFAIPPGTDVGAGANPPVTYYSRFRIYNGLPFNPQPNYRTYDSGGTLLCGEIEDPPFTLDNGTTTPVTLATAGATRDGANVRFAWTTATEVGNVGFNVYGKTATGWRKLNAELIPAVGGGIDPRSYEATIAVPEGVTEFYIEDVDLNGTGTAHGEFTAVEDAAKAHGDDPPAGAGATAGAQGVNPT